LSGNKEKRKTADRKNNMITTILHDLKATEETNDYIITTTAYRYTMSYLIEIIKHEWEKIKKLHPVRQCKIVESLISQPEPNIPLQKQCQHYSEMPSNMRKACIAKAISIVSAYRTNLDNVGQYVG
jgi:hypothetical protein